MPLDPGTGQLITVLGAAGALLYVLKLIIDGKLHASSEVDGLRKDKEILQIANAQLGQALDKANEQLATIIQLIREDLHGPQ